MKENKPILSFDPLAAFVGTPEPESVNFPKELLSLFRLGRWAWGYLNTGHWKTIDDFELTWLTTERILQRCVETQSKSILTVGTSKKYLRADFRDLDWLDEGLRRGVHKEITKKRLALSYRLQTMPEKELTADDIVSHQIGADFAELTIFAPCRLYWAFAIVSIDRALRAHKSGDVKKLVDHSVEAAEAVRAGLNTFYEPQRKRAIDPLEGAREFATMGAMAKNEPMRNLKRFVQAKYLNGTWKSKRQAAQRLVTIALDEATKNGVSLSRDRAQTTLYEWILELKA
jgi:hypothetical protein